MGKLPGFPNFNIEVSLSYRGENWMKIYYPAYYYKFRCIASDCPDSCCKEWTVDVDREAAAAYRAMPGALGERLRSVLKDTEDGTIMENENGRCPMWQQDGLCRIQAELGHDALCDVCRQFPRLRHDYGDFVEMGLELSCPEAAGLILGSEQAQMCCTEQPGGELPEYDGEVMAILRQSRAQMLELLDDTRYSLPEALAIMLLHSHNVQARLDGGEGDIFDPESCLEQARKFAKVGDMAALFSFFSGLEILAEDWAERLKSLPEPIRWTQPLRALARYMIGRYWLQTVSDYDLVCRVKLTVVACLLVGALGGDVIQTAQQFSKEIENDPDNIEAILDGGHTAPALTDVNLLSLLLA